MSRLERLYGHSPVLAQNVMSTAFGVRERILRFGGSYESYCDELDRAQWMGRAALDQIQAARLRAMVSFCAEHVPYYRQLFSHLGLVPGDIRSPRDLHLLPVLDKEAVRDDPEAFRPLTLRERPVAQSTGGTTGAPLRYWVTPSAMQYTYATYEVRFRNWAGISFGEPMASINGRKVVPVSQSKPPFWRYNLAFNQLYLSAYHMTDDNLPSYLEKLRRFQPKVIVGYVSSIHLLAEYMLRNNLAGSVSPTAVLVSSETLFPWMRSDIEAAFGCKVHDGYGLGELAAFITECKYGGMHISPEYGVVEEVMIRNEAHLVATGLFNHAMPLLRYDTGDVVELAKFSDRCACGRELPLVKRLLGRADDYVITPDGRAVGPAPLSLAFQGVQGIREAQIRQFDECAIEVLLVTNAEYNDSSQMRLETELEDRLGSLLEIGYRKVDSIPRTTWGKRRLIDSAIGRRDEGRR